VASGRIVVPVALAAFAAAYLWQAQAIPLDPWSASEAIHARTLPLAYGALLLVLALALLIRSAWPRRSAETAPDAGSKRRWLTLAKHSAAIVGFGALIPFAGLGLALAALLLASLRSAGERRPLLLALAPLGTAGLAWLLIAVLLGVYIDPGRWFS